MVIGFTRFVPFVLTGAARAAVRVYSLRLVMPGVALVAGFALFTPAAHAGCEGKHIIAANVKTLNFYDADGKTVVDTVVGKTADNSLNILIQACDANYFYVETPNTKAQAEVLRASVSVDEKICEIDVKASNAGPDRTPRHGNAGFDGNAKCQKTN